MMEVKQTLTTRNQSEAQYESKQIFLFNNLYKDAVFLNDTGGDMELLPGHLVTRDTSGKVVLAKDSTLDKVIGVVSVEQAVEVVDGEELSITYCHGGRIDTTQLTLPGAATMDTPVVTDGPFLKDYLQSIGFDCEVTVSNSKFR